MGTLNRDILDTIVKKISENENVIDPKVDYKYGGKNGDGYIGVINAFEIKGKNKELSLIIKSAPTNLKVRGSAPVHETFVTEAKFYDEIMPTYRRYQEKYGIKNGFNEVPKCFATNLVELQEMVVLENIKIHGYDLWDRTKGMNNEHIEFVFHEYGKFHAISYSMQKNEPEMHEDLIKDIPKVLDLFLDNTTMGELFIEQTKVLMGLLDPAEDKVVLEKMSPLVENITKILKDISKPDEFSAITHGDCWCNNMMFKYNDNKLKPVSMRLLDFQLVEYASPVLDLSYFYYVCASPELLDKVEHYLKIYHKSLSERLREFGCNPEEILPYSELYKKWEEKSRFGLIMSIFLFKLMLTDKEDAVNLTEAAENNTNANPLDAFAYEVKDHSKYLERALPVLRHFCKFRFI